MSSLKPAETKLFEDIFGMSSGYVLDFTNKSFGAFFRRTVSVDIMADKYAAHGTSKAQRLREFWELESDPLVGKALSEMLDYWKVSISSTDAKAAEPRCNQSRSVVLRLLGKQPETTPEQEFLKKYFSSLSVKKLPLDTEMALILEARLAEATQCLNSNASLATIFMCGSILEGILLGLATHNPADFNRAAASPKDGAGKVKQFHDWTLAQFIDVAHELGHLKLDVKRFSHVLRDFRNYIHPYEQRSSRFTPDRHTATMCFQVLKAAIADLSGARK